MRRPQGAGRRQHRLRSARRSTLDGRDIHVVDGEQLPARDDETFHPWIAVLLNFSPDHLDRHATLEEYAAAKARIFSNQQADDWAIVNVGRRRRRWPWPARGAGCCRSAVGGDRRRHRRRRRHDRRTAAAGVDTPLVPVSAVRLLGRHLLTDVAARGGRRRDRRRQRRAMVARVEGFTGLEHALEPVVDSGVGFVNDSKATNIEAAARPSRARAGAGRDPRRAVQGRRLRPLRAPLARREASVVAIGEAAPLRRGALARRCRCARRRRLDDAVRLGSRWRRRAAPFCSRRRARASTCSRTTRSAGGGSRTPCPSRVRGEERA
jgi:UDP-N-acetylmuramoylalanine--D-glutamate ligase